MIPPMLNPMSVVRVDSVRMLFSLAAALGLEVDGVDVRRSSNPVERAQEGGIYA